MYTFKPQAKQNAKRFLTKTCKLENFEEYLCQDGDGQWGCYLDAEGAPVKNVTVLGSFQAVPDDSRAPLAPETVAADMAETMSAINASIDAVLGSSAQAEPAAPVEEQPEAQEADTQEAPAAAAFGAFAVAQLTAVALPAEVATAVQRKGAARTAGLRIEREREIKNGVQRNSKGSIGDTLWCMYDAIGPTCTLSQARTVAEAAGFNRTSGAICLYKWRRFHGYTGK